MNIAQIIPCLGVKSGGPSRSVCELVKGLRNAGIGAEIITQNYVDNPNIVSEDWIKAVSVNKISFFEYNPEYKRLLKDAIITDGIQLLHINSIFSYPTFLAASLAKRMGVPYVIAPRGALYKSAMQGSSRLKKCLFNKLFLIRQLNNANAVHATCIAEEESIRALGITSPIAVIPNSISLPENKPELSCPNKLRFCFLGRIAPQKNLEGLLKAWHQAELGMDNNLELLVIGAAQLEKEKMYLSELHKLENELDIENVRWVGSKEGKEKEDLLRSCSYLILPSFSENFGMVVTEALQYGIPVIASKGSPWKILEERRCGWWTDIDPTSLASCLKKVKDISEEARHEMGKRGQQLVWDEFSTEKVTRMQINLYNWILYKGEKPDFVKLY